jgi:pimeloyl-ACP methyl ester carboxylesterase
MEEMRRLAPILLLTASVAAQPAWIEEIAAKAETAHWSTRWEAVLAFAGKARGEDLFALRPLLLRDARARVRGAVAWAAVLEPRVANATLLGLALKKDKSAEVRFAAAAALAVHRDRRAVEALITALQKETDPRVRLRIADTLRQLTPGPCLLEAEAWRAWWNEHKADPRFQPADEPPRSKEYEGVVLETRTVAIVRKPGDRKGPPPHVLVLPPFGFNRAIWGSYMLPLRRFANVSSVMLPSVQQLTGRSGYGKDIPVYPVDRLVRALDRYRAEKKIESFLVLAPGASGWIAMRYAQVYPERVRALMLIDTALDKQAYADSLMRASARGNKGERFTADTLMHRNNARFNRRTLDRLQAYGIERGFHDRADLEIGHLYARARQPQGFATVPDIRWGKRAQLDVPALFVYSAASPLSGHVEMMRITKHFPRAVVTPLSNARGLPYVEENAKLFEVIDAFLTKHGLR